MLLSGTSDGSDSHETSSTDFEYVPVTTPVCAARSDDCEPCKGIAHVPCPECLLVAYCDDRCRERAWRNHQYECIGEKASDVLEQMRADVGKQHGIRPNPSSNQESFWAKYAATDVLNLEKNEGPYYDGVLRLLFAGDSGLRHLIYSVVNLPKTAAPAFDVYISEPSTTEHLARTLYALMILRDTTNDPYLNAEAIVHIWYSAKMPVALYQHICRLVLNPLNDMSKAVKRYYEDKDFADTRKCSVQWDGGPINLRLEVTRSEWQNILTHLQVPENFGQSEVTGIRALDMAKHGESFQRINARMTPARALGLKRWRQDGLLLPYGHPRDSFDTLNPIFFHASLYPPGATAEPLSEWPMEFLDFEGCPSPNDVYGKMFYYVRHKLVQFQEITRHIPMTVHLSTEGIEQLPGTIQTQRFWNPSFDRIEVGQHWDQNPMLTLVSVVNLLRHVDENPSATMLTMSRESVTHSSDSVEKDLKEEKKLLYTDSKSTLDRYAPPVKRRQASGLQEILRRQIGLLMWRNWDRFSEHYFNHSDKFRFNSTLPLKKKGNYSSIFPLGFLGLVPKAKNTVTRRWPNRLIHRKNSAPSLREVNRWIGWVDHQPERWLEWKKVEDTPSETWLSWLALAVREEQLRLQIHHGIRGEGSSTEDFDSDEEDMVGDEKEIAIANETEQAVSQTVTAEEKAEAKNDGDHSGEDDAKAKKGGKRKTKNKKKKGGK